MIFVYGGLMLAAAATTVLSMLVLKAGQARRASKKPSCQYCGGTALHLSSPRGLTDQLLTNWNCLPYRCEVCSRRQYRLAAQPANDNP
jgi:hypothetical protein